MDFERWWQNIYLRHPHRYYNSNLEVVKNIIVKDKLYGGDNVASSLEYIHMLMGEPNPRLMRLEYINQPLFVNDADSWHVVSKFQGELGSNTSRWRPCSQVSPGICPRFLTHNFSNFDRFYRLPIDWKVGIRDFLVFQRSLIPEYRQDYVLHVNPLNRHLNNGTDIRNIKSWILRDIYLSVPDYVIEDYGDHDTPLTYCYNANKKVADFYLEALNRQIDKINERLLNETGNTQVSLERVR